MNEIIETETEIKLASLTSKVEELEKLRQIKELERRKKQLEAGLSNEFRHSYIF